MLIRKRRKRIKFLDEDHLERIHQESGEESAAGKSWQGWQEFDPLAPAGQNQQGPSIVSSISIQDQLDEIPICGLMKRHHW